MSHYSSIKIVCDWPDCYARIDTWKPKLGEARKKAAEQGWKRVAGIVDLCGKKVNDDSDSWGWRGHADRTDHAPITKPAGKGDVHLTCVCGWVFVSPHAWQAAGTTSRNTAYYHWGKHTQAASVNTGSNPSSGGES